MIILVTGAAGFIGYHFCRRLLDGAPNSVSPPVGAGGETSLASVGGGERSLQPNGAPANESVQFNVGSGDMTTYQSNGEPLQIIGIDNLNDYYDTTLKHDRLHQLQTYDNFQFMRMDLADRDAMAALFAQHAFDYVVHLGAQAGVRYSIDNPHAYADSNLVGHLNVLEGCRQAQVKHLIYASSSSVYGMNTQMPFSTEHSVDHPVSLYAATKKANELMSHSYSHLYNIPTTGLRFFTVYGSWGRPDMAPMIFAQAITQGQPIQINNHGNMQRDFTHVSDIVESMMRLLEVPPAHTPGWTPEEGTPSTSCAPYRVYNIGAGQPTSLMDFIEALEAELGQVAKKDYRAMQAGDVVATWAETEDLFSAINYRPQFGLKEGIPEFVNWFKAYYKLSID